MPPTEQRATTPTTMTLSQIEVLARRLMDRHGLDDWGFAFDRAKRRLGSCQVGRRRITLSRYITTVPTWAVRDTILHEIAHALDFVRHGSSDHGARWRTIAREVGAEPARRARVSMEADHRHTAVCDRCGYRHGFDRDPLRFEERTYTHRRCGGRLRLEKRA